MKLLGLQKEADACWRKTAKAEVAWRKAARARTPETWRAEIDKIAEMPLRIKAACLVWWDFFADRPATDPWRHLDDLTQQYKPGMGEDNPTKLRAALLALGYLPRTLDRRLSEEQ